MYSFNLFSLILLTHIQLYRLCADVSPGYVANVNMNV